MDKSQAEMGRAKEESQNRKLSASANWVGKPQNTVDTVDTVDLRKIVDTVDTVEHS